jgi:serine/threonine-protein kinase
MGAVWEARHAVVDRRFAVKFLLPQLSASAEARRRFEREARAAGTIESEHVVAVVDYGVSDGGEPFLVMEYLEGEDLARLLEREGQLALPRAVSLLLQAARGVAKAHARGIVHRDVKPRNLFVLRRDDGLESCKVLDFGVAKLIEPTSGISTKTGDMIGTLEYMAPEQVRGEPNVDARVDVYALGAVFYEMLAGKRPYQGHEAHVVMYRILEGRGQPLTELRAGIPQGILGVLERAMHRDPQKRYADAAELVAALAPHASVTPRSPPAVDGEAVTLVGGSGSQPSSSSSSIRSRSELRIRRRLVPLLAAVAAVSLALGLWRQKPRPSAAATVSSPPTSSTATPTRPEPSRQAEPSARSAPEPIPTSTLVSTAPVLSLASNRPVRAPAVRPLDSAAKPSVAPSASVPAKAPRANFDLGASPYD